MVIRRNKQFIDWLVVLIVSIGIFVIGVNDACGFDTLAITGYKGRGYKGDTYVIG